ncbi:MULTISPECIES: hypothetical protein [Geobacillus]|uniref:hypothetical protein n=1 Tax=Geobacillus TaxID=129337 RepID=UPI000FFE3EC3|nr:MULTISPECIES: hypothetical protein [Geobacillus]
MNGKFILFLGLFSVAFLIVGCQNSTTNSKTTEIISLSEIEEKVIEKYLLEEVMDSNYCGEIFAAYEILGTDEIVSEVYLWALIQEYYNKGEVIEKGSGMSDPIVLHVEKNKGSLKVLGHTLLRDGSYYLKDIKELFPTNIQDKILNYPSNYISQLIE